MDGEAGVAKPDTSSKCPSCRPVSCWPLLRNPPFRKSFKDWREPIHDYKLCDGDEEYVDPEQKVVHLTFL